MLRAEVDIKDIRYRDERQNCYEGQHDASFSPGEFIQNFDGPLDGLSRWLVNSL